MFSSLQTSSKLDDFAFIVMGYDSYVSSYFKSRNRRHLSFHYILNLSKRFILKLLPFDPPIRVKRFFEFRKDLIDSAREMSETKGISFNDSELRDIAATITEFHLGVNSLKKQT